MQYSTPRYAYRTQACYECSSVDGSDPMCEFMDDKYQFSMLDRYQDNYTVLKLSFVFSVNVTSAQQKVTARLLLDAFTQKSAVICR